MANLEIPKLKATRHSVAYRWHQLHFLIKPRTLIQPMIKSRHKPQLRDVRFDAWWLAGVKPRRFYMDAEL